MSHFPVAVCRNKRSLGTVFLTIPQHFQRFESSWCPEEEFAGTGDVSPRVRSDFALLFQWPRSDEVRVPEEEPHHHRHPDREHHARRAWLNLCPDASRLHPAVQENAALREPLRMMPSAMPQHTFRQSYDSSSRLRFSA